MDLDRLLRQETNAARHIQRCTSATGPLRRLPFEMLSRIFAFHRELCFQTETSGVEDLLGISLFDASEVLLVAHICAKWRTVALETQELWGSFHFRCPGHPLRPDTFLGWETWLKRGGRHPHSFKYSCPGNHNMEPGPDAKNTCRHVLRLFLEHSAQWKCAQLSLPYSSSDTLIQAEGKVPLLEQLHLNIVLLPTITIPGIAAFSIAPKLRPVRLGKGLPRVVTLP